MTPSLPPKRRKKRSRPRPFGCWFIFFGFFLIFLWAGLKSWRLYQIGQSLQAQQTKVEQLLHEGALNPAEVAPLVTQLHQDVTALHQEVALFLPLTPYLTWLPQVGPLMPAIPHLLEMASAGSETGFLLVQAAQPTLTQWETLPPAEQLPHLLTSLQTNQATLTQAQQSFDRFRQARQTLGDSSALPWRIRTLLEKIDPLLPFAEQGFLLLPHLPEIAGVNGPRTYLILAQNEDELRPTGGYISGVGRVEVANGRVINLAFEDAGTIDNWAAKPYPSPPQALYQFMGSELFLFRDSNFWPHFPTSAGVALDLYSYGQDVPVDGLMAIDQQFLTLLLAGLGDLPVTELGLTLTAANIQNQLRQGWETGESTETWLTSRKAFMGPMATAIRHRLENEWGQLNLPVLAQNLYLALQEKHLQLYFRDPHLQNTLNTIGWDGAITGRPGQDTLFVVDTNVGFNKANALVESTLHYELFLNQPQPQAITTLTYHHLSSTQTECNPQPPLYVQGLQYETLIDKCLWNYVRLYTPSMTVLQSASQLPVPAQFFVTQQAWNGQTQQFIDQTMGLNVLANFFLLAYGQQVNVQFTYQLPDVLEELPDGGLKYTLTIYKQAGAKPKPVTLVIHPPAGYTATSASWPLTNTTPLLFETVLQQNTTFTIWFNPN